MSQIPSELRASHASSAASQPQAQPSQPTEDGTAQQPCPSCNQLILGTVSAYVAHVNRCLAASVQQPHELKPRLKLQEPLDLQQFIALSCAVHPLIRAQLMLSFYKLANLSIIASRPKDETDLVHKAIQQKNQLSHSLPASSSSSSSHPHAQREFAAPPAKREKRNPSHQTPTRASTRSRLHFTLSSRASSSSAPRFTSPKPSATAATSASNLSVTIDSDDIEMTIPTQPILQSFDFSLPALDDAPTPTTDDSVSPAIARNGFAEDRDWTYLSPGVSSDLSAVDSVEYSSIAQQRIGLPLPSAVAFDSSIKTVLDARFRSHSQATSHSSCAEDVMWSPAAQLAASEEKADFVLPSPAAEGLAKDPKLAFSSGIPLLDDPSTTEAERSDFDDLFGFDMRNINTPKSKEASLFSPLSRQALMNSLANSIAPSPSSSSSLADDTDSSFGFPPSSAWPSLLQEKASGQSRASRGSKRFREESDNETLSFA